MSMKHRSPWVVGCTVATALALSLTACGGDGGSEGTKPGENGGASAAQPKKPGEKIELDFVHRLPDGEGMTTVAEIVEKWNKEHPDIQVKATKFDGKAADLIVRLESDFKAGNAPCIAFTGYAEVPELYVKGLLADVTQEAEKYKGNYTEGAYNLMSVGGTITGLPQDVGPLVYFYNEDAFKELGIDVPTDLAGFQETAAKAKEKGKYISAFTPDEAHYWLSSQSAAAGDAWFSAENDEWVVSANGDGSKTVADFWQKMLDDKTTLVTQRWGDGFTKALVEGQLIGHIGAAWEAGFILDPLDGTKDEGKWRVAQLMDFGAGKVTGPDGGSGLSVMKDCKYPAEAMEFIDWFNTQTDDLATQGIVTATTNTVETPEKMKKQFGGQDVLAEMKTASENLAIDFGYAPGFSTLSTMNQVADEVGAGKKKMTDIFDTAQKTGVDTLKNLGLPVKEG